jgi:hypothetical protein
MAARIPEDNAIKNCPSFAAYDAKRTEWEAESDPVAKRALQREKHALSDQLATECGV